METFFLLSKKWSHRYRLFLNFFLAGVFILTSFTLRNPFTVKAVSYSLMREAVKRNIFLKTWNWNTLEGEYFLLKYQDGDASVAGLVLETAEDIFLPINEALDYTPPEKVLMVMYPDKAALNKSFGWDADESAMGVYWAGAIRILSPQDWIENKQVIAEVFKDQGPVAHEYTHLVVDYITKGNYTRWLTEGVAQYLERQLTGFQFPLQPVAKENLYPFSRMDGTFDSLPDQSQAYGQSLAAMDFYVESYGFDSLVNLLKDLGAGKSLNQAFLHNTGQSLSDFEEEVQVYYVQSRSLKTAS